MREPIRWLNEGTVSLLRPSVIVTATGTFLAYVVASALTPIAEKAWLAPPFLLSKVDVGVYLSIPGIAYLVATLPVGYLVDQLSLRGVRLKKEQLRTKGQGAMSKKELVDTILAKDGLVKV